MDIVRYERRWRDFKEYVEEKARGRCYISNKNWMKLREFHLQQFLNEIEHPFAFLFHVKYFHPKKYRKIHCMPKYYGIYKQYRQELFKDMHDEFID